MLPWKWVALCALLECALMTRLASATCSAEKMLSARYPGPLNRASMASSARWSNSQTFLMIASIHAPDHFELPDTLRPGHDVEVIALIAMRGAHRVIATRDQHHRPVLGGHGLVKLPAVIIDPVQDKALWRVHAMIVGFFKIGFFRKTSVSCLCGG